MDLEIQIEFARTGDDATEGALECIKLPYPLPYMPEIGLFGFNPSGLMKDDQQRQIYLQLEERYGSSIVSDIYVSFTQDKQRVIILLEFEKDYQPDP